MALVTCPECGRQVSTRAEACPGCGCPVAGDAHGVPLDAPPSPPSHDQFGGLSSAAAAADDAPASLIGTQPALPDSDGVSSSLVSSAPALPVRSSFRKWIWLGGGVLACALVLVVALARRKTRRPTEAECAAAIAAYYDALGWDRGEMTFRISIDDSIASCRESGSLAEVLCFRRSKAPFRECRGLSGIELESLEQGAYCFEVVDNETGRRWPGACAFSWQACEGRRSAAILGAYRARSGGKTFEDCTTRPALFGIRNLEVEGNWYGLSATVDVCYARWRAHRSQLTNVAPGCHRVGGGAEDLGAVDEPARPTAAPMAAPPGGFYCQDATLGSHCHASMEECKTDPAWRAFADCRRALEVFTYSVDGSRSRLFATRSECDRDADQRWSAGEDASTCVRSP